MRRLFAAVAGVGLLAIVATTASAAPTFRATASMTPQVQYLNDTTGTVFTFTVVNLGDTRFAAVDIARPSPSWVVRACPLAPAGWTTERHVWGCRFRSRVTASDDIPGHSSNANFRVKATVRPGSDNLVGRWRVVVSRTRSFSLGRDLRSAPPLTPGLRMVAHSFQVLDAVVVPSPLAIGSACPAPTAANHSAITGSTGHTVAVCGRNRTNAPRKPAAAHSSLGGTFIASHGGFASGSIRANSGNVVLGNWSNVAITSSAGAGKTIAAKIGSNPVRTSPVTTLSGYTATNEPPVAAAVSAATNEDAASGPITLSASDPNGDPITFSIASGPAHGTLGAISPAACPSTAPAAHTCTATVVYTPAVNYNGPDSFTYIATDTFAAASAAATVSLTVNQVNDTPVVNPATFSLPENSANGTAVGTATASDADTGQTRSFTIQAGNTGGAFAINASSGAITVANSAALDFETTPTFALTVRATDNGSPVLFGQASITVNLTGVNDAPTLATSGGSTSYTENLAPVAIDGALTVSDADDVNIEGATVRISVGFQPGDHLEFTDTVTIFGSYDSGTGVLTLTGTSSVANYQTALRSVGFSSTNDNPSAAKTVAFRVNDGTVNSAEATKAIAITPVNDAPTVVTSGGSAAFTENGTAATIDGGLTVTDPDSSLDGARVRVIDFASGDFLAFTNQLGINGVYNLGTGVLTLSGTSSVANYQTALRTIQYNSPSQDPPSSKSIGFIVNDGAIDSGEATKSIAITSVNDAPTLDAISDPAAIDEDAGEQNELLAGISAGGGESQALTVTAISSNPGLIPNPTVTYTSPNATGNLAYTPVGNASGTAVITVRVDDDGGTANGGVNTFSQTFTVTVNAVNDGPVITAPASIPAQVDTPTAVTGVSIADPDSGADDITFTVGTGDVDSTLTFDLSVAGWVEGTEVVGNGENFVTVNAPVSEINATLAATNGLVYQSEAGFGGATDTIDLDVNDQGKNGSGGALLDDATITVDFDEPPSIATGGGPTAYTENGAAVVIESAVTITDADDANMDGAVVRISADFQAGDVLAYTDVAPITSSYNSGTGVLTLSGVTTKAAYETALESVTFSSTNDDPETQRTIGFTVDDGDIVSNEAETTITVTPANDAPVVTATPGTLNYTEGDGAVVIDGFVAVTDADDTELEGAIVDVASCQSGQDVLGFVDTADITGSFDVPTCTLTLTGTADVADYQAALRSVTYSNGTDDPNTSTRIVTFHVDDGDATGEDSRLIDIFASNDAPTDIALSDASIPENQPGGTSVGTFTTTDADSADTHLYELVAGVGDTDNASFQINTDSLDAVGSFDFETKSSYSIRVRTMDSGTGNLWFEESFTITVTDVNEAPTAIAMDNQDVDENQPVGTLIGMFSTTDVDAGDTHSYAIVSGLGDEDNDSFTISGNQLLTDEIFDYETKDTYFVRVESTDSGSLSFSWSFSIDINDINDAPEAGPDSYDAVGNTGLFVGSPTPPAGQAAKSTSGSVLDNDNDPEGALIVVEPVSSQATTGGGTVTIEADGEFVYHPDAADLGTDTFTYRVCDVDPCEAATPDGNQTTGTVTITLTGQVWYVRNNEAEGGDGTSDTPFNTLLEAEAASGTGDTVFVFAGDGTATNLGGNSTYIMDANERLFGEANGLTIDPDAGGPLGTVSLYAATAGRPKLVDINNDVISLASGAEIRGVDIDPNGTGGGIYGGAGVVGGTIDNVHINDTIADGHGVEAGLELAGTSGTFNISNLEVDNFARGVVLLNAGTVNFLSAGDISINTSGDAGLTGFGTSLGTSVFDDITVTGSGNGGVSLVNTTGTTTFNDLSLTTTAGSDAAFLLSTVGSVTVTDAGTANVSATGGPAIDVTSPIAATLAFDTVSSTNSAGNGIRLSGLDTGTFSASGGTVSGATGIAITVSGGSGDITYPGNLGNGAGQAVTITGRSGGTVALAGSIADTNDAGGGILLSGNSGTGSTLLSGSSKTINTTIAGSPTQNNAIVMDSSPGHTLTISGGNLDIDTGTGKGLEATGGGTLNVTGTGSSISTSTGRALNISGTTIGASGVTFQSIGTTGSVVGPLNAITLANTGSAGGLTVTGTGSANSGGTITGVTGTAHGVSLTNTQDVSLSWMNIQNTGGSGIFGTGVTNFSFVNGTINNSGTGLAAQTSNLAFNTQAAGTENNLSGTVTITGNTLTGAYYHGISIFNFAGTISDLNVSNNTLTSSASTASSLGGGIQIVAFGSAGGVASISKATLDNNTINNFPSGVGLQVQCGNANSEAAPASTCGTPGSGTNVVAITNNDINATGLGSTVKTGAEGIIALVNGRGQGNFNVSNNTVQETTGTSISSSAFGDATVVETIANNTVVSNNMVASQGIGIGTSTTGGFVTNTPNLTATIASNNISQTDGNGILAVARDSQAGLLRVSITNNVVAAPLAGVRQGIRIDAGNSAGADNDVCLNIAGNTSAPSVGGPAALGIGLRKEGTSSTVNAFGIVGLSPSPATGPQTQAFVNSQNPSGGGTLLISSQDGFTSCPSF